VFGRYFILAGMVGVIECVAKVGEALFTMQLIVFFNDPTVPVWQGYVYAIAVGICGIVHALAHQHFFFHNTVVGVQARIGMIGTLYRKAQRLSTSGISSTGKIINMISNDVQRLEDAGPFAQFVWVGPLETIVILLILLYLVGIASLFGFMVLFSLIPLQGWFGRRFGRIRKQTVAFRDTRIRMLSDMLNGIQVLKLYSWEIPFQDALVQIRHSEFACLLQAAVMKAVNESIYFASPVLISMFTFVPYVLLGNQLSTDTVFTTLALFNVVRLTMASFFPKGVETVSELRISLVRLQEFLMLEELPARPLPSSSLSLGVEAVSITDGTFSWASQEPEVAAMENPPPQSQSRSLFSRSRSLFSRSAYQTLAEDKSKDDQGEGAELEPVVAVRRGPALSNVNLTVRMGELVAIIGPVGAGKSSLAQAVLGEIACQRGETKVMGRIAYTGQTPWILPGTVRDNILFGAQLDDGRFRDAIFHACLEDDLASFPNGADSFVGDKGINLSGGQRARIGLARALYSDADIYILDDPLSAVDTRVGRHLFEKAIREFLRTKAVILITHQLQFATQADTIILIEGGHITAVRTTLVSRVSLTTKMTHYFSLFCDSEVRLTISANGTLILRVPLCPTARTRQGSQGAPVQTKRRRTWRRWWTLRRRLSTTRARKTR